MSGSKQQNGDEDTTLRTTPAAPDHPLDNNSWCCGDCWAQQQQQQEPNQKVTTVRLGSYVLQQQQQQQQQQQHNSQLQAAAPSMRLSKSNKNGGAIVVIRTSTVAYCLVTFLMISTLANYGMLLVSSTLEEETKTTSSSFSFSIVNGRHFEQSQKKQQQQQQQKQQQKQTRTKSRKSPDDTTYYERSIQCPGCRHHEIRSGTRCGTVIDKHIAKGMSVPEALQETIHRFPDQCGAVCSCFNNTTTNNNNNNNNNNNDKYYYKYWYLDRTFPEPMQHVSYYLSSIPPHSRIPNHVDILTNTFNMTQFMMHKWNHGHQINVFFEYNPTIVVLPRGGGSSSSMRAALATKFPNAVYLISFRVSSDHACYPWEGVKEYWNREQFEALRTQNLLGLALLDHDLQLIPNSDFVIDLETQLFQSDSTNISSSKKAFHFVDYRLYTFHQKVYLNINGPPCILVPIEIRIQPAEETIQQQQQQSRNIKNLNAQNLFKNHNQPILFNNKFDHGDNNSSLQLVFMTTPNIINGAPHGKNFALFQTADMVESSSSSVVAAAEYRILGPRIVQHLALDDPPYYLAKCEYKYQVTEGASGCKQRASYEKKHEPVRFVEAGLLRRHVVATSPYMITDNNDNTEPKQSHPHPIWPSFATVDELWFSNPVFEQFSHGGACCISLQIPSSPPQQQQHQQPPRNHGDSTMTELVFVGVGHTKVAHRQWMRDPKLARQVEDQPSHQYASFFYAFEPKPPYRIVARSGLFCLPFATEEETITINAYHSLTKSSRLHFKGHEFACPKISFVSGIVEHASDPNNKVIVPYGINDCTSRIVVISKQEIAQLLFRGLDWKTQ